MVSTVRTCHEFEDQFPVSRSGLKLLAVNSSVRQRL
jgi:hypothetical protein